MIFLFIFFPMVNACCVWVFEMVLGKIYTILIVAHFYILFFIFGFWIFLYVCVLGNNYYMTVGTWINCGLFVVNWGFIFDSLSVTMLLMVSIISGAVHFYSRGYMCGDPHIIKFVSYLSLFTFFMFILITADNLVLLFLGWEGIGLCSYLLISFWSTRIQANKAALKALIMNRVGDFGFLCGCILLYFFLRTIDFSIIFVLSPLLSLSTICIGGIRISCLDIVCLFLFIGSMGKSALVGLHTWLPDAMNGPTPVSALIHAATLVTAGVFLIIRSSPMFEYSSIALFCVLLIGGVSAFMATTIAVSQNDIKRVIAYSTASQLGYMVFVCGLSAYNTGMFHLVNHAFFKALLFLGAGSVIHALSGEQDMRKFGGIIKLIPFTYSLLIIGFFALSGLPFLSGFYSKDLILETAMSTYTVGGVFLHWLGTISAGLTAFYSFRILFLTFWGEVVSYKFYVQHTHELPRGMQFTLTFLMFGSVFSGYVFKDAFVGMGNTFWGGSIFISGKNSIGLDFEFIPVFYKNIPIVFSFIGIFCACFLNKFVLLHLISAVSCKTSTTSWKQLIKYPQTLIMYIWFLNKKWYFDYLYNYYIGYMVLTLAYESCYKLIDKGFLEFFGIQILSVISYKIALILRKNQSGIIYHCGCLLLLWFVSLVYLFLIV